MAAAGTSNAGVRLLRHLGSRRPDRSVFHRQRGSYNLNYKPYVDHIGGAAFASIDGSTVTLRLVFTAK
jgi:hypothetical protein